MSKRIPCNECREHKRRCSGDSPCERCQRLKLNCVYTIKKSPKDEEYIQEVEMIEQIDTLQHHIALMEAEIAKLQQTQLVIPHPSPIASSLTETDSYGGSVYSSVDGRSRNSKSESGEQIEKQHIIARNERGYSVVVAPTKEEVNWELTVANGNLSIKTNIHNHTELLDSLRKMVTTIEFESKMPTEFDSFAKDNMLSAVIRMLIWKRYGKSRFKGYVKQLAIMNKDEQEPRKISPSVVESCELTTGLFWAHIRCQHHLRLTLHTQTFFEMFIADGRSDFSPAALALCAHVCLHPCRHVTELIPKDQLRDYGAYFAERAQDELRERFDDMSLEVFVGNVYISFYCIHTNKISEAQKYNDIAKRLSHILEPQYPTVDTGESALYHRVLNTLNSISMLLHAIHMEKTKYHSMDRSKPNHNMGRFIAESHRMQEFFIQPVPGDSQQEISFIHAFQSYSLLRHEVFRIAKTFQGTDLMDFIGVFGHQLEMVMRLWYTETLAPEYRLSLPLFDDTVSEDVFYQTLMTETAQSPIPVITTLRVYSEYLVMVKSYLPDSYAINHELTPTTSNSGSEKDQHWTNRRIYKLLMIRDQIDYDGSDEEYLETVLGALKIDTRELKYSILKMGVKTAICCLRILRFLLHNPRDICLFDVRTCVDGYDLLRRICKIFLYDDREYSLQIRKLMEQYLDFMREAMELEPLGIRLSKKFPEMEKQLEDLTHMDPENASFNDLSAYVDL